MGRMKQIYEQIVEDIQWGRLPAPRTPAPPKPVTQTVHVLTCNGKPVAAYVHLPIAEYEMWLCRKGDEAVGNEPNDYKITSVSVCADAVPYEFKE